MYVCVCVRERERQRQRERGKDFFKSFFFFLIEGMNNLENCYFAIHHYENCFRQRLSKVKCCWRTEYIHNVKVHKLPTHYNF